MAKCELCNSSEQNNTAYGDFKRLDRIWVHEFCLYLSSGLVQNGEDDEGIFGFLPKDILKERERVKKLECYFCHQNYANIGCCEKKCHKTFHLICGLKNGVENQFVGTFRSYCTYHIRKERKKTPKSEEICCICYDRLLVKGKRNFYVERIKAPCCNNGWFHKSCLQSFANSAGYFFKCPLCNDSGTFRQRIPYLGVFVPNRDASWELEPNAFADLLQRPRKCEAEICRNRKGREDIEDDRNPLLCCSTCGSLSPAVHKYCLPRGQHNFFCTQCEPIATAFPSTAEGDSGRESLQAVDDEDVEVDVCNISDSDDSSSIIKRKLCKKKGQVICDSSDNAEEDTLHSLNDSPTHKSNDDDSDEIKPFSTKTKVQRFFYNTSNDEDTGSAEPTPSTESSESEISTDDLHRHVNEKSLRKRKFIDDKVENSSSDNSVTNLENATDNTDEDDPLEFFDKLIAKKRKLQTRKVTQSSDSSPQTSQNKIPSRKYAKTITTANNRYKNNSLSSESGSSQESNHSANYLETSCIANRTRTRRKTINISSSSINNSNSSSCSSSRSSSSSDLSTTDTPGYKNTKRNRAANNRFIRSSTSSSCSNEESEKKPISPLEVSCIARRTRRRKTMSDSQRNLGTIGEEAVSESSESSQTLSENMEMSRDRINDADHSKDDGFSSDFSSKNCRTSFSNMYSMPRNKKPVHNRRLRLVSLTSEEEFDENDAMKNR